MTPIEISEKIRDHLTKQKAVSKVPYGCAYRGDGGLMCAVGCLIDDAHYTIRIEQRSVQHPPVREAIGKSLGITPTNDLIRMLEDWQGYHDGYYYYKWSSHADGEPTSVELVSPIDFHNDIVENINSGVYA